MEGVLREPWRSEGRIEISKVSARYGSFTYQFAKRQNNATNACLIRHGPTSSPNDIGAGSVEKGVIVILYEVSRKWKIRQTRQNLTITNKADTQIIYANVL